MVASLKRDALGLIGLVLGIVFDAGNVLQKLVHFRIAFGLRNIADANRFIKRGARILAELQIGERLFEGRILPYATRQEMTLNADGTLAPLTPGSTQPVVTIVHHAGIVKTKRFSFPAPW